MREPFVWEAQARRELMVAEVTELRNLPHSLWRDVVQTPMVRKLFAADGQKYVLELKAELTGTNDDIRVTLALRSADWRKRRLDTQSFLVTLDGRVTA